MSSKLAVWGATIALSLVAAPACLAQADGGEFAFAQAGPGAALPAVSRDAAIATAVQITGLTSWARAQYGAATDSTVPFFDVSNRLVWLVDFDSVTLAGHTRDGQAITNPNIRTLSVLVDATSGMPLKVFSPRPEIGRLRLLSGTGGKHRLLDIDGMTLRPTQGPALSSFLHALQVADFGAGGGRTPAVAEAKEVVAYYGLLTDKLREQVKDEPFWLVFLGGVTSPPPRMPRRYTGPTGPSHEAETVVALRATSSLPYSSETLTPPRVVQPAG